MLRRSRFRKAQLRGAAEQAAAPESPPAKAGGLELPGGLSDEAAMAEIADDYAEMERAGKRDSLLGRANQAFQDMIQTGRGNLSRPESALDASDEAGVTADDLAIRRARGVKMQKMIVPEGVIIQGSMSSGSETEISGRVDGDVTVDGRLFLGPTALVSGSVRATSCRVEGLVEGRVECSQDLELGASGRLNADALAGRNMLVAGHILGNVTTSGLVRLSESAEVTGDIRARRLVIEEGAYFNGTCRMRAPAQQEERK